jgi:hypothetical protein
MDDGHCLDFSHRTMAEFFEDEMGVDIDQEQYSINGTSKAKLMRSFIQIEDGPSVSAILRKLISHKTTMPESQGKDLDQEIEWVIKLANSISTGSPLV